MTEEAAIASITEELAAWFREAVVVADCWYFARANAIVMPSGGSVPQACEVVANFAGDMPDGVRELLSTLAKALDLSLPASNSYADGAQCLLDIHRELQVRYP